VEAITTTMEDMVDTTATVEVAAHIPVHGIKRTVLGGHPKFPFILQQWRILLR
jgi:hypothetical protein